MPTRGGAGGIRIASRRREVSRITASACGYLAKAAYPYDPGHLATSSREGHWPLAETCAILHVSRVWNGGEGDAGVLQRIQSHASYSNVMATLAVFVALGGTSYAAITLPRNSVGEQQLRARAVGPQGIKRNASRLLARIKNGTIRRQDISRATRDLPGGQYPAPVGPPGAPGVSPSGGQ